VNIRSTWESCNSSNGPNWKTSEATLSADKTQRRRIHNGRLIQRQRFQKM